MAGTTFTKLIPQNAMKNLKPVQTRILLCSIRQTHYVWKKKAASLGQVMEEKSWIGIQGWCVTKRKRVPQEEGPGMASLYI